MGLKGAAELRAAWAGMDVSEAWGLGSQAAASGLGSAPRVRLGWQMPGGVARCDEDMGPGRHTGTHCLLGQDSGQEAHEVDAASCREGTHGRHGSWSTHPRPCLHV